MSHDPSPGAKSNKASGKESQKAFLLYCVAFVALLLVVVMANGGSSLHGRVQHWEYLRVSIQSMDPARQVLDDEAEDTALIEDLLLPSPDRHERARAYYNNWRAGKDWKVTVEGKKVSEGLADGMVNLYFEMTRGNQVEVYWERSVWVKQSGMWYLKESKEVLETKAEVPKSELVLP
ncbi:MAG: hypothetical protein WC655_18310 [Candidatus Hydrogenedentales bacterium]|jgi:hypothetical protein